MSGTSSCDSLLTVYLPEYTTSWQVENHARVGGRECGIASTATLSRAVPLAIQERSTHTILQWFWFDFGLVPANLVFAASLFRGNLSEGNGGAIFPIRRRARFIPEQLADLAKLCDAVRGLLIPP